ncbi:hypothetical protein PtA15_6A831 [Puccinia triticina]|uniref:Conserved oligomeric Golgi complex subunit 1 n=1 Tax=Puccinia triticina TaxID=208348 RepID=A0ABY7CNF6_9BASI|nr:uncharacterized protein PtA15_6A831 [Puccinia triticina]WAQ86199.1 hypothetical protein PtA15_6A831 [Puccinia triticina]WAR56088.1 hypothetical protein PtB15_6B833 [Puccinia triticina]
MSKSASSSAGSPPPLRSRHSTRPEDIDLLSIDDPDDLFPNFTIREIRAIEQRARADADQKREDLRQMVGERYRDLLSAADSIVRMKISSENLLGSLDHARLQSDRNRLKSKAQLAANSHTSSITGSSKLSYILATLLRLLLDLSEHIWRSLEQEDFLTASRYESLGRIISNELTSGNWDPSGETEPKEVIEMFPIVERQSETLAQLGPQISARAKGFLRKWEANSQATMEALAAVVLMDTTSLSDSLQLLLLVRKTAFNSLIARLNGSWTELIKNAVKLLLATLDNVEQIFLKDDLTDLLKSVQEGSSEEKHLKPLLSLLPNAHQLIHHIPQSIINFCPFVAALAGSEDLRPHSITESWFQACQLELISYIDKKLDQVQSTQTLVEFRSSLREMIGEPNGQFQSTIERFGKAVLASLNKRFYELYQHRLDQLKIEIIQSLKQTDRGRTSKESKRENWIFDKKLPALEPNDPTKFPKYLRSIQSRIEGKMIEQEEDHDEQNKTGSSSSGGIVKKMEKVARLLQDDFRSWEEERDKSRSRYLDLGAQFTTSCLQEINAILDEHIEKSDVERELSVGDLALQILSTRNSFMVDLSLQDRDDLQQSLTQQSSFIESFQSGLNQILSRSSRHWAQSIVDQAVLIFQSSHRKLAQNSHYFLLEATTTDESRMVTRPSEALFISLSFISNSTTRSLGVHRLKAQQAGLLDTLIEGFVRGILDDRFRKLVAEAKLHGPQNQYLLDSIFFDLAFLVHLFFSSPGRSIPHARQGLEVINETIDLVLGIEGGEGRRTKMEEIEGQVSRFKLTIVRLWWPLIPLHGLAEDRERSREDDGEGDDIDGRAPPQKPSGLIRPDQSKSSLVDFRKLPKFAGIRCVKPGNRFTLMSAQ